MHGLLLDRLYLRHSGDLSNFHSNQALAQTVTMLLSSPSSSTVPTISIRTLQSRKIKNPARLSVTAMAATSACKRAAQKGGGDDYHSTLKALNSRGRRTPRKSLGQHYMVNSSINEQLAGAAQVGDGDIVLEIGPGTGSLTNVLINAGATVVAVEKDPHMAALVEDRFGATEQLTVLQEDFVKCDIRFHLSSLLENKKHTGLAKVVANIPFNISTNVVKHLLPMGDIFSEVVLLLQDETALRLVDASLRTSEYRPISIFVNFYSDPEYKFKVERSNFFPRPNVDAAVVRFKLKKVLEYPQVSSTKNFFSMVSSAFNGKRKMLRKSLQHLCSSHDIESALKDADLPITARPEVLTLDDFVMLHNSILKFNILDVKE